MGWKGMRRAHSAQPNSVCLLGRRVAAVCSQLRCLKDCAAIFVTADAVLQEGDAGVAKSALIAQQGYPGRRSWELQRTHARRLRHMIYFVTACVNT